MEASLNPNEFTPNETPWQFICRNKPKAAIGLSLGLALGCGIKYVAAVALILAMLVGGQ
jgi:hypothetical protein